MSPKKSIHKVRQQPQSTNNERRSLSIDTDQLKFPEYVAAFIGIPMTVIDQDIIPAFQVFDLEKTGFIAADDILKSLANVGEQLDEVETKAFKDNMNINEQGLFDYNGKTNLSHCFVLNDDLIVVEFYLKFTEPPKPKRKKKGKKKKKSK